MGSKKVQKDCKPKSRTSPRKQNTARDVEPEEESQEQSQKPSQEPGPLDELPEGEAAAHGDGDGEKTEKVGTVWTPEQDEQIVAFFEDTFFEDNTLFYDMANSEYKNKKKQENLLLDLARTMFKSGKCKFSFQFIFPVSNLLHNVVHFLNFFVIRHEFVVQY